MGREPTTIYCGATCSAGSEKKAKDKTGRFPAGNRPVSFLLKSEGSSIRSYRDPRELNRKAIFREIDCPPERTSRIQFEFLAGPRAGITAFRLVFP